MFLKISSTKVDNLKLKFSESDTAPHTQNSLNSFRAFLRVSTILRLLISISTLDAFCQSGSYFSEYQGLETLGLSQIQGTFDRISTKWNLVPTATLISVYTLRITSATSRPDMQASENLRLARTTKYLPYSQYLLQNMVRINILQNIMLSETGF